MNKYTVTGGGCLPGRQLAGSHQHPAAEIPGQPLCGLRHLLPPQALQALYFRFLKNISRCSFSSRYLLLGYHVLLGIS